MYEGLLVFNAGSSSVKFAIYSAPGGSGAAPAEQCRGQIKNIGSHSGFTSSGPGVVDNRGPDLSEVSDHESAIDALIAWMERSGVRVVAAGHRVVHGGAEFTEPILLSSDVVERIAAFSSLAPHHQVHNVAAIRALMKRHPSLVQVACFDTAFHTSQPAVAQNLGLPREFDSRGLRRYGFHGLSYDHTVQALTEYYKGSLPSRLVVAHLGNGASMCAIRDGRSVATTMGFSTLDGLVMGTRCGAIDPGVLIHLLRHEQMSPEDLEELLYNKCGLLGVSGVSSDMQALLESDEVAAAEAVEFFCYRAGRELGSLAAALGGLDALVFTGGIGENSPQIRAAIGEGARWLGVLIDRDRNSAGKMGIGASDSTVRVHVVAADEESVIARHTANILAAS